jgi:hypothetical protein
MIIDDEAFNKTESEINLTDNNTDKITNLNRKEDENVCAR